MQVQVTREIFISQTKAQIENIELRQKVIQNTITDLKGAIQALSDFGRNPSLTNISTLAEGLLLMTRSHLHSFELEQKFLHTQVEQARENLRQAESPIQLANLAPPKIGRA